MSSGKRIARMMDSTSERVLYKSGEISRVPSPVLLPSAERQSAPPDMYLASRAPLATGYLLLFSGMALVGVYTALSKPLSAVFPVFLLAWLRFAIAALVMIPWLLRAEDEPRPLAATRRTLFLQSLFGNFLFSILMLSGVAMTSAAAAGVVMAALPPLVAVFSWWFLREHAGSRVWLATALAAAARAGRAQRRVHGRAATGCHGGRGHRAR